METNGVRRVAVIGAGPSGIFATQALLAQTAFEVEVDVFDRMPTPFGLVRYGVAPDHTGIKGVTPSLARVLESERVSFFGLVEFGRDVTRDELLARYDAVVYAAGAGEDYRLGVPGEQLPGSRSARAFVAWYSGHPDATPQSLAGVRSAVTFGVGNVAVDVARILLADPDRLSTTDMPQPVLDELRAHRVPDVWLVGRRGPQHATFTTPELRALLALDGVALDIDPEDLAVTDDITDRRARGNLEALRAAQGRRVDAPRARLHLLFWQRPVRFEGEEALEAVLLERTALGADGSLVGTGEVRRVATQLALRAIGYRGVPLAGVPFDPVRHVIPNAEGRVIGPDGVAAPQEYAAGWIKRGPVGVIGTNKSDAVQTVGHLVADLAARPPVFAPGDAHAWLSAKGVRASTFADWLRIDAAEESLGASRGRDRTKVATWDSLTSIALDRGED